MRLRTVVGVVKVVVWQGKDPADQHWGCPIRERWSLRAHQQMSPGLEEKLAFTATLAGSYEAAAQVAEQIVSAELQHLYLAHLSSDCNRPEIARDVVGGALDRLGATHVRIETATQHVPCPMLTFGDNCPELL